MNDITENAAVAAKAIQNKNNMNVTENQANVFQTEATAQLDDHKSVVNGQNSSENISTEQEEGAQGTTGVSPVDTKGFIDNLSLADTEVRHVLSFKKHVASCKVNLAGITTNRKVSRSQVNKLEADCHDKFLNAATAIPAPLVVASNPKVGLFDLVTGEEIDTTDATLLQRYIVIADGQHRATACIEKNLDMDIILIDYAGDINDYMVKLNSFAKNWNNEDHKHLLVEKGEKDCTLFKETEDFVKWFGCSPKTAEFWLTFRLDNTKKTDLIKGDVPNFNPHHGERGKYIAGAAFKAFGKENIKYIRRLQFVQAVKYVYDKISDNHKPLFTASMTNFFNQMTEEQRTTVVEHISTTNYGNLNKYLYKEYEKYMNITNKNKVVFHLNLYENAKPGIDAAINEAREMPVTRLKEGRPLDLILNEKKSKSRGKISKAEDNARKAKAKAEKAVMDAEQAQAELENLYNELNTNETIISSNVC